MRGISLFLLALCACMGSIDAPIGSPTGDPTNPTNPTNPTQGAAALCDGQDSTLRQLSRTEINATFNLIAGDTTNAALTLEESNPSGYFFNDRAQQFWNDSRVSALENGVVGPVVDALITREQALAQAQRQVLTCDITLASCVKQVITDFGRMAWRRPLTAAEVNDLVALATTAASSSPLEGLRWALKGILLSPDFVFVIEAGAPRAPLDPYALATRLSLALWGTTPDGPLLSAAADGSLATPAGFTQQADRLLAGPRAPDHFLSNIGGNWLAVNTSQAPILTDTKYALYSAARASMLGETSAFVRNLMAANAPLSDVLTAGYSFIDGPLAKFYGVTGITGSTLQKATLPSARSGVLTQGLVMALTTGPKNPIFRGVWVFERLMCRVFNRPANAPDLPPASTTGTPQTVTQILDAHVAAPQCASCHKLIDPVGLTLEQLDDATDIQSMYADGTPVEDTQTLFNGASVTGARGLGESLATGSDFSSCAVKQLSAYAYGVSPMALSVDQLSTTHGTWMGTSKGVRDLLETVVKSPDFKTVCGAQQ
jgi:hypothetical protein